MSTRTLLILGVVFLGVIASVSVGGVLLHLSKAAAERADRARLAEIEAEYKKANGQIEYARFQLVSTSQTMADFNAQQTHREKHSERQVAVMHKYRQLQSGESDFSKRERLWEQQQKELDALVAAHVKEHGELLAGQEAAKKAREKAVEERLAPHYQTCERLAAEWAAIAARRPHWRLRPLGE